MYKLLWQHRRRFFSYGRLKQFSSMLDIKDEVHEAIINNRAVVALESTIITHGMPYPQNLRTALEVENVVREQGAIPATIGILKGRIKVGLTQTQLEELADTKATNVVKTSRRDLAYVLSKRLNGGTTVAGTLICSQLAGIKIFATGGIGGVHRDGESTMDISADLVEMGKSSVTVVSSGIKSILDIPRSMEVLETHGVLVSTYQVPDREFPAFYTRTSGVKAQYNFNDAVDAAECINKSNQVGLKSSILIGVPVPVEYSMDGQLINNAIAKALEEADKIGIKGKDVTPFILSAVAKITAGKSLETNMALIKNNAKVAAQIAVELAKLQKNDGDDKSIFTSFAAPQSKATPLVIGGSILDIHYRIEESALELKGATYNAKTTLSAGGVGRNLAEGLFKLNGSVSLISAFGNDSNGDFLRRTLPSSATASSKISNDVSTASCAIILDKSGDCKLHVGDMNIHREITPQLIYQQAHLIESTPLICMDANLSLEAMDAILLLARKFDKPVFYEPTDMLIAHKPFKLEPIQYRQIKFMSPNIYELRKIAETLKPSLSSSSLREDDLKIDNGMYFSEIAELCDNLHDVVDIYMIVTVGNLGVVVQGRSRDAESTFFTRDFQYNNNKHGDKMLRHYPTVTMVRDDMVSSTGAGDAFNSGFITAMLKHKSEAICVSVGFEAAVASLRSMNAVPMEFFNERHPCWKTPAQYNIVKQ